MQTTMKFITFDYTDAKGKDTSREVLVTSEPTYLYSGTDLSEMSDEDQAEYVVRRMQLEEEYVAKIKQLDKEFDNNYRFRQFKYENMSNIIVD